jgi:hypothetical protein
MSVLKELTAKIEGEFTLPHMTKVLEVVGESDNNLKLSVLILVEISISTQESTYCTQ